MQKVVKNKNLAAFKIWLELLGYTVKTFQDGKAFSFRFKKQYGLVTAANTGNELAYRLGKEFEEHLRAA